MDGAETTLHLIGRLLIAFLFLGTLATNAIMKFEQHRARMAAAGIPMAKLALIVGFTMQGVGGLMLAHTAGHEGLLAAHTIAGDRDTHPMDYTAQPRATYCRPEIASVGLTEQQCQDQGLPYKVGKVPFQAIAKAIIGGEYEGFAKVIGSTETDDLLGVHVIGPHATDLIAEASLALTLDATPWEIGAATHPHPTLAEVVGEAAMAVDGRSINF